MTSPRVFDVVNANHQSASEAVHIEGKREQGTEGCAYVKVSLGGDSQLNGKIENEVHEELQTEDKEKSSLCFVEIFEGKR